MAIYLLVHGAWHGGWCWDKVVPGLKAAGHTVHAPDLPGRGGDATPLGEITLDSYVEHLGAILAAQTEPVILVGHSLGGLAITQTGEQYPEHLAKLVYLAAYLPGDGQVSADLRDPDSLVIANLRMSEDGVSMTVKDEAIRPGLYADCSDEDVARATSLLVPEAVAPTRIPLRTTPGNWGRIPRVYIACLQDQTIPHAAQERMYTAHPCERVITMDCSHSPFFSQPEQLVGHLLSL